MDGRMTVCNMSIEAGARAGMIAPDEAAFAYLEGRDFAPKGADWDAADAAVEALSRTGAPLPALSALRADALFGRQQEAYLAESAPASELSLLALEPPVYPNRALVRGIEGWVDLEFVVDRQGRVRNAVVTGAEPAGEFEASALAAAEAYVFEPFELDGRSYERRVGLRMRFALQ